MNTKTSGRMKALIGIVQSLDKLQSECKEGGVTTQVVKTNTT